jgi:hypothetical protein
MGESRLLGEVTGMARRLSIRVGSGVADPSDTVVQLSVLMEALFEGPSPIIERTALGDAHSSPEQRYMSHLRLGDPKPRSLAAAQCRRGANVGNKRRRRPYILPHYSYLIAGLVPKAQLKIDPGSAPGLLFQHHDEFASDVHAFLS